MSDNILTKIKEEYGNFSKGHKLVAEFILEHYEKSAFMTAAKLGEAVGVSESTVVRFAAEIGFDGYPCLQRELRRIIPLKLTSLQRMEIADERIGADDVLEKVMGLDIERIRQTLEETSREAFSKAVDSICTSKNIYIIASRSSSALSGFLYHYFNLMLKNVRLIEGNNEMFENIMGLDRDCCMIGISFPRYSKSTVKALEYASERGAGIIAITDSVSSPLIDSADHVLLARSDMASFADSLVAPLSLINALIVAVGIKKHDEAAERFQELEYIWDKYEIYEK